MQTLGRAKLQSGGDFDSAKQSESTRGKIAEILLYDYLTKNTHAHETSKVLGWGDTGNWQENSLF